MSALPHICLIEDDPIMGESLQDRFKLEGFEVTWHQSAVGVVEDIRSNAYALIISDINLPEMSGEEMFLDLLASSRILPTFIFITGYGSIEKAVHLIRLGATDFITKPFDLDHLIDKARALAQREPITIGEATEAYLGISSAMRNIERSLPRVAENAATVLLTGESGVGKEHVAKLIHQLIPGADDRPFMAVNCGAISESLLESELFGYEKGAFTGANRTNKGVFELADGGTLFLDEIGDMSLNMQVKLLRVLQEKSVRRVGGDKDISIDVRIILATHRDLKSMVKEGSFREDLFYRIHVIHLHVPPLRERVEDILWFAEKFLQEYLDAHPEEVKEFDHAAERALLEHSWPGNLRELNHAIERACILGGQSKLTASAIFADAETQLMDKCPIPDNEEQLSDFLQGCERDYIVGSLESHNWQIVETATALGISRKNLWEKMKKYDISAN